MSVEAHHNQDNHVNIYSFCRYKNERTKTKPSFRLSYSRVFASFTLVLVDVKNKEKEKEEFQKKNFEILDVQEQKK